MYFTPHVLLVKQTPSLEYDEYGQAVQADGEDEWQVLSPCRCDDSNIQEITDPVGHVFRPSYHIVAPSAIIGKVKVGDTVKCVYKANKDVARGMGVVKNIKGLNCLDYAELWI